MEDMSIVMEATVSEANNFNMLYLFVPSKQIRQRVRCTESLQNSTRSASPISMAPSTTHRRRED